MGLPGTRGPHGLRRLRTLIARRASHVPHVRAVRAVLGLAAAALRLAQAGCRRTTEVGSLVCQASTDCAPPDTVCGPDGRCLDGCLADPSACVGGSSRQ